MIASAPRVSTRPMKVSRFGTAIALSSALFLGCSSSLLDELPDSISHEPSDEAPTQKNSTTYQPNDFVESTEPDSSYESDEPSQAGND